MKKLLVLIVCFFASVSSYADVTDFYNDFTSHPPDLSDVLSEVQEASAELATNLPYIYGFLSSKYTVVYNSVAKLSQSFSELSGVCKAAVGLTLATTAVATFSGRNAFPVSIAIGLPIVAAIPCAFTTIDAKLMMKDDEAKRKNPKYQDLVNFLGEQNADSVLRMKADGVDDKIIGERIDFLIRTGVAIDDQMS